MKPDSITGNDVVAERSAAEPNDEIRSPRIADLVEAAARRRPDAPALVVTADRVPVSYRDLIRLVDDLAGQLKRGGLLPGDRVALRSGSNAEFVIGLLAASRAELIVVPLDPALPVTEQRTRSEAAGARVVLVDGIDHPGEEAEREPGSRWWPIAVTVGRDRGAEEGANAVILDAATPPKTDISTPEGLRHDDAMIMFTGGTTGVPKMVPWTHDNIASAVRAIVAGYGLGPQDATVAVMPLYHGHGLLAALLSTLASGGTVLGAHVLGRHRCRPGHLVHRGPDDSPDPVGARPERRAGEASRVAFHPQLQRPAHPGNGAGAAGHLPRAGGVCFRHDRGDSPSGHDSD